MMTESTWRSLRSKANAARSILATLAGWVLLGPLTFVIPRRKDLVLVFGRDGGRFSDNAKHLYARATQRSDLGKRFVFAARSPSLSGDIRSLGGEATVTSSLGFWLYWLRAGTIVFDSTDWLHGFRLAGSRGARLVQLWHGIPLKVVQLARVRDGSRLRAGIVHVMYSWYAAVTGRYLASDWLLSTSVFVTNSAFSNSFRYRRICHAGYPRNDALLNDPDPLTLLGIDNRARSVIRAFRQSSPDGSVVLYAPTFRESLADPFFNGAVDFHGFAELAASRNQLLLVKLHPWMQGHLKSEVPRGVVLVEPESDVYPLLREVDVLVTDYSSIFFDFLLLDRPVVFLAYDLDRYLREERSMYFDYSAMTPGPKARSMIELESAMDEAMSKPDPWAEERTRVRRLVFDESKGRAADRLLDEVFQKVDPNKEN